MLTVSEIKLQLLADRCRFPTDRDDFVLVSTLDEDVPQYLQERFR